MPILNGIFNSKFMASDSIPGTLPGQAHRTSLSLDQLAVDSPAPGFKHLLPHGHIEKLKLRPCECLSLGRKVAGVLVRFADKMNFCSDAIHWSSSAHKN